MCKKTGQTAIEADAPGTCIPRSMVNESGLNLSPRRSPDSVWNRRGWDGSRQLAVTRWLIGTGGCALAVEGLRRRSLRGSLLAGVGAGLGWWAFAGPSDLSGLRRWYGERLERAGWRREDLIQQTSAESFPASDAPSWTPTVGTGLRNRPFIGRHRPAFSSGRR